MAQTLRHQEQKHYKAQDNESVELYMVWELQTLYLAIARRCHFRSCVIELQCTLGRILRNPNSPPEDFHVERV